MEMDKILFMGLAQSGKTSICSLIVEETIRNDHSEHIPTIKYNRMTKDFIINDTHKKLQIIDTGGQISYFQLFYDKLEEFLFSDIAVFIWVIDIATLDIPSNKELLGKAVESLKKYSPDSKILCFLHKSDLVKTKVLNDSITRLENDLFFGLDKTITFFTTTIFNDSIQKIIENYIKLNVPLI